MQPIGFKKFCCKNKLNILNFWCRNCRVLPSKKLRFDIKIKIVYNSCRLLKQIFKKGQFMNLKLKELYDKSEREFLDSIYNKTCTKNDYKNMISMYRTAIVSAIEDKDLEIEANILLGGLVIGDHEDEIEALNERILNTSPFNGKIVSSCKNRSDFRKFLELEYLQVLDNYNESKFLAENDTLIRFYADKLEQLNYAFAKITIANPDVTNILQAFYNDRFSRQNRGSIEVDINAVLDNNSRERAEQIFADQKEPARSMLDIAKCRELKYYAKYDDIELKLESMWKFERRAMVAKLLMPKRRAFMERFIKGEVPKRNAKKHIEESQRI